MDNADLLFVKVAKTRYILIMPIEQKRSSGVVGIVVFVVFFLLLAFLTVEVMTAHSAIVAGDLAFENMLLGVRTAFFLQVFNAITYLGNTYVVAVVTAAAGIFLFLSRHSRAYLVGLAVTVIGAGTVDYIMKLLIERARPGGLIPSTIETSYSFPSGHATFALALYGFFAYVLCRAYPKHARSIVMLASVLILLVGFSRLYLGVHFPSDVLAGYLLGGLWLLIGIRIVRLRLKKVL